MGIKTFILQIILEMKVNNFLNTITYDFYDDEKVISIKLYRALLLYTRMNSKKELEQAQKQMIRISKHAYNKNKLH